MRRNKQILLNAVWRSEKWAAKGTGLDILLQKLMLLAQCFLSVTNSIMTLTGRRILYF